MHAHQRIYAAFFLYAFAIGGLYPRLPEIQERIGAAEGALGMALIGSAVGTFMSLTFSGPLIERLGHRLCLLAGIPLVGLGYAAAAWATSPWALFVWLLPTGWCIGMVEIIVNIEADRVEHQRGHRLMNRAHAFWSLGFFSAGLVGAAMSRWSVSPQMHLALLAALIPLGVWLCLGGFQAAPHRPATLGAGVPGEPGAPTRWARPTWGITVLVAVCLSAMLMEGAGIDWSALYMRDVFETTPFVAGLAVATGALAQAITRFFADGFVERHSPVRVARALLLVLGVGVTLVVLAPHPAVAFTGLALMGVGTSAIFPLAMSAAAQRTDRPAAVNVAALAQTAFVAFLLGPPLLGWVAEAWGLRTAFGIGLPLVGLSLWAASALAPQGLNSPAARENR